MKKEISSVNVKALLAKCTKNNIPDVQVILIEQIVQSAMSKNSKNNEEWLMLCLLLHIRSPNSIYEKLKHITSSMYQNNTMIFISN